MGDSFQSLDYEFIKEKPQSFLVKRLTELNLKISIAESCTGGLLCKMITDTPGASKIFEYGFCTYSNESKIKILGVSKKTLDKCSAVSKEVALEMVLGAKKISKSDLAISVTGYAGSKMERKYNKNVGLVFIGIALNDRNYVINLDFRKNVDFSRRIIRKLGAKHAISAALTLLNIK